jgi:hypothetical protein
MKNTNLLFASLFLCVAAQAQSTFVNYRLNFVGGIAATNIVVGANVLARQVNSLGNNLTGGTVTVVYPGVAPITLDLANAANYSILTSPFLGPCTLQVSFHGSAGAAGVLLMQYDVVNATLPAQGVIVQPAGSGAAVSLQSSTNLTTWAAATNGVYSATGQNRFFRMGLTLQ